MIKRGSTIFLRSAVLALGLAVLAICLFALPIGIHEDKTGYYRPVLYSLYIAAVPFFFALYQTLRLLHFIDTEKAFSYLSTKALKHIKYCANTIAAFFAAGLPYLYHLAQKDDAPGVIVLGLIIVFASLVISVFAAVLQRLLLDAIDIKSENDLTV